RRDWLRLATAGVIGTSVSGWLEALASDAAAHPERRRSCILLWMNGGPSQMDTFDLKPGTANGGPYKEIQTSVAGLKISEHLPKIAKFGDRMAVVRSMSTKEGDHERATFYLRTGYLPQGPIQYPPLGALVSKEIGRDDAPLPNFVSIAPFRFFQASAVAPGFLGPTYAPLIVGDSSGRPNQPGPDYEQTLKVQDLDVARHVSRAHADARIELLQGLQKDFLESRPGIATQSHLAAYDRAVRLMRTEAAKAFDLEREKATLRDAYGRNLFGQGCLLARRLIERGVPFVEVTMGGINGGAFGWDTHGNNFEQVKQLSAVLDAAWGTLMTDLKERGLLDSTLIVWMGEFGRTPQINQNGGRDHFPNAWSTALAGGGIKGGGAVGKTSKDGTKVEDRKVTVQDFLATICEALGIDPTKQNQSNVGRPIRIVDKSANAIKEIVA
ncbi:MAG TPA: DUF1501 domain-containing protein, partial [Gemmataceae bacterium]|nr:DUF1501 domain-containing protein [Gemmataceae bacterium]